MRLAVLTLAQAAYSILTLAQAACLIAPDRPMTAAPDAPPFTGPCTELPTDVVLDVAGTMPRAGGTGLIRAGHVNMLPVVYFFEPRREFSSTCATQSVMLSGGSAVSIRAVAPYNNTDILVLALVNNLLEVRQLRIDADQLTEAAGKITSDIPLTSIPYGSNTPDTGNAVNPFVAAKGNIVLFGGAGVRFSSLPITGLHQSAPPMFTASETTPLGLPLYFVAPLANHNSADFILTGQQYTWTANGAAPFATSRTTTGACPTFTLANECPGRVARAVTDLEVGASRLASVSSTRLGFVEAFFDENVHSAASMTTNLDLPGRRALDVAIDELSNTGAYANGFEVILLTNQSGNHFVSTFGGAIRQATDLDGLAPTVDLGVQSVHTRIVTGKFDLAKPRHLYILSTQPKGVAGTEDLCLAHDLSGC